MKINSLICVRLSGCSCCADTFPTCSCSRTPRVLRPQHRHHRVVFLQNSPLLLCRLHRLFCHGAMSICHSTDVEFNVMPPTLHCVGSRDAKTVACSSYLSLGHGVASNSRILKIIDLFAEYSLFYRAFLQKRPIILRSLLFVATRHQPTRRGSAIIGSAIN